MVASKPVEVPGAIWRAARPSMVKIELFELCATSSVVRSFSERREVRKKDL
jgi:hypothetical protein